MLTVASVLVSGEGSIKIGRGNSLCSWIIVLILPMNIGVNKNIHFRIT